VDFEWDEDKNLENIRKHGFDFGDAWESSSLGNGSGILKLKNPS